MEGFVHIIFLRVTESVVEAAPVEMVGMVCDLARVEQKNGEEQV